MDCLEGPPVKKKTQTLYANNAQRYAKLANFVTGHFVLLKALAIRKRCLSRLYFSIPRVII